MRAQPIPVLVVVLFVGVVALPAMAIAQSASKSPRTPWGDPDLQGDWTSQSELGVPFERAAEFGTRQELSDEEFAKAAQRLSAERERDNAEFDLESADRSNAGAVGSATSPPPHWLERGNPSRRTSMVIDPPDGRVPAITADARARIQRQVRGSFGNGPFNGPTDFTLYDRCITRGVPGSMFPAVYNANTRIVQGPGFVAITYEMIHETRIIPVDGRDHIASDIRQYHGDSRGRWDGEALVVTTTNIGYRWFNGNGIPLGPGAALEERFALNDDGSRLNYTMTIADSATFTAPVTLRKSWEWRPGEQVKPYQCRQ